MSYLKLIFFLSKKKNKLTCSCVLLALNNLKFTKLLYFKQKLIISVRNTIYFEIYIKYNEIIMIYIYLNFTLKNH